MFSEFLADRFKPLLTTKKVMFHEMKMTGWIYVGPEGIDLDVTLQTGCSWLLDFNPKAKLSKKRK